MIFPSQLVPNSGDFVIEHLNDSVENRRLLNAFSAGKNAYGESRKPVLSHGLISFRLSF